MRGRNACGASVVWFGCRFECSLYRGHAVDVHAALIRKSPLGAIRATWARHLVSVDELGEHYADA